MEGFWAKGGWRSVAKGKERYSALCGAERSVGALVTLSQGRQGLKVPELSKNFKKPGSDFDKYAESDKTRSQSARETNQRGVNQV